MSTESESLTHSLLERMRAEHTAAMDAMMTELAATRRVFASMEGVHDKIDRFQTDLSAFRTDMAAFRAETGKALRQIQGDVMALETQNIARHGEVLNILRRIDDVELRLGQEESAGTY